MTFPGVAYSLPFHHLPGQGWFLSGALGMQMSVTAGIYMGVKHLSFI